MSDQTPYSTRPAGERAREATCFRAILEGAKRPDIVLETFAGIGDTTAILSEFWPDASLVSTELDPVTALEHQERHGDDGCVIGDCLEYDWGHSVDCMFEGAVLGIVLDYNLLTLKRLREEGSFVRKVLEAVPVERASWITVTDAAIGKLHLNARSYGVKDLDEYIAALEVELADLLSARGGRWSLGSWAKHSRASYLRMDRRD